mmetsp:Transcript_12812/g.20630  ORF Transcript_12812/g.20630 Transcript_12812/m.20630 type:complete len:232 (-) Transcript_12812:42-737(-)
MNRMSAFTRDLVAFKDFSQTVVFGTAERQAYLLLDFLGVHLGQATGHAMTFSVDVGIMKQTFSILLEFVSQLRDFLGLLVGRQFGNRRIHNQVRFFKQSFAKPNNRNLRRARFKDGIKHAIHKQVQVLHLRRRGDRGRGKEDPVQEWVSRGRMRLGNQIVLGSTKSFDVGGTCRFDMVISNVRMRLEVVMVMMVAVVGHSTRTDSREDNSREESHGQSKVHRDKLRDKVIL